jgi:glycosyltransferase involved in cell wall biosynthesis
MIQDGPQVFKLEKGGKCSIIHSASQDLAKDYRMPETGVVKKNPTIIAAVPAFNEERYIGSVVLKARQHVDRVIVFDDGSTDGTADVARLAGATVLKNERNRGKGAAMRDLISAARGLSPYAVVFLDSDGQHEANEIPRLVQGIRDGYDLVIGSRKADKQKTPFYRRIGQWVLSFGTGVVTRGRKVLDSESGFRALSARALAELRLTEDGFAVETEMIVKGTELGLRVTEVPTSSIYVEDGSTQNPVKHGFGVLGKVIIMISERRPLLFFGMGGSFVCLLGIIAGIRVLNSLARNGAFAIGTALLCAMFLIVGVFSIFTGIVLNILASRSGNQNR